MDSAIKINERLTNECVKTLIAQYLGESNNLTQCIKAAESYNQTVETGDYKLPFRHNLMINFTELIEVSDVLGNILLSEPHYFNYLINLVVHCALTTIGDFDLSLDDVIISLRINLPTFPSLIDLAANQVKTGLFMIRGILISVTAPSKLRQSTVYSCPVVGCENNIHGERIYNCFGRKIKCSICDTTKIEVHSAQEFTDQVIGILIKQDSLDPKSYKHSQGHTIFFKGDLCKCLILGGNYDVTVCYEEGCLTAWGVHRQMNNSRTRLQNGIAFEPIPSSIQNLIIFIREKWPQSPWALTTALSLTLAPHLAPSDCFLHLRAGILLSLASHSGISNTQPVHLISINSDGKSILEHCSKLAERTISGWPMDSNLASIACLDDKSNNIWYDAGPLLMAGRGVCYLGEWSNYERSNSFTVLQIKQALENGQVKMGMRGASRLGPSSHLPNHPLLCSIWSVLHKKPNAYKNKEKIRIRSIIELFGMPFIGDCEWACQTQNITSHLLTQATKISGDKERPHISRNDFGISEDDLKKYLDVILSYPVRISAKACALLRKYFVATRRSRPDGLPLSSIKIMTALSEAHARINMRQNVTENDAMFVIYLYEQSVTYMYGSSSFSSINPKLFTIAKNDCAASIDNIPGEVDNNIIKFSVSLETSLKLLVNDDSIGSVSTEE